LRESDEKVVFKTSASQNDMPTSYQSIWEIEEETPNETHEIYWNQPCRVKLMGTDFYMCTIQDEAEGATTLGLTSDTDNKNTLFAFVPPQQVCFL
jgi:hypothetical protein